MRCRSALFAVALALGTAAAPAWAQETVITALDDVFDPAGPKVPVGASVTFVNDGDNLHTVTADDGSFDSGDLAAGETFTVTLDEPGRVPFFCEYHGAPGGFGMAGTILVGGGEPATEEPDVQPPPPGSGETIRVPLDQATVQGAVDAAAPGDLVLISPGVYHEAVRVTTPFLTIRGTDRNEVVLEGDFERPNGIHVLDADGVTVENMTARHYLLNGFYWIGVEGYRGSYLTAYNNGDYGVYAFDSVDGQFDHSYASGHPDSGFYIGQCNPCNAVVTDVLAEHNALGWSGTNASGRLTIANSEWRNNRAGIVPNTLDSELLPPQREQTVVGNWVHDNNNVSAPVKPGTYAAFGIGILATGTLGNVIERNLVEDHVGYGIAVMPMLDRHLWIAGGNRVEGNVIRGSGVADLALGAPAAGENCFAGNDFATSAPPAVEVFNGCAFSTTGGGGGDLSATAALLGRFAEAEGEEFARGDWRTQPEPPPQPSMPNAATVPAAPAIAMPAAMNPASVPLPRGVGDRNRDVGRDVTVLGVSLAAPSFWSLLISLYGYVLPVVLYASWVSVAMWDLIRREDTSVAGRGAWMAAILLVPLVGPLAYYAFGRSPIPAGLRLLLVGGGLVVYALFAGLSFAVASS